jgi:hypothetical protein
MSANRLIVTLAAAGLVMSLSISTVKTEGAQHAGHGSASSGRVSGPVPEDVRRETARFRDVNAAIAAGYAQFGGCVSGQDEGAMGVHFANFALFDADLDVANPEVLVYEPRNGRLQLVAAEYITPAAAWAAAHGPSALPHLAGHLLHFAPGPNRYGPDAFWEIHVWAWKNNPRGAFADWNPTVSCSEWESPL